MGEKAEVSELDAKNLPILVGRDHGPKCTDSSVVQSKGPGHASSVRLLRGWLEATGYPNLILKSDGEPSIVALKRVAVADLRKAGGVINVKFEESPVGDRQKMAGLNVPSGRSSRSPGRWCSTRATSKRPSSA